VKIDRDTFEAIYSKLRPCGSKRRDELLGYIYDRVSYAQDYVPLNLSNVMTFITNEIIELYPEMTPEIAVTVGIMLYDQTKHTVGLLWPLLPEPQRIPADPNNLPF
jgi:hypothetical protein